MGKRGRGRLGHTAFDKGTRVLVILRSGARYVDKFVDRKQPFIILEERGRVHLKGVRSVGAYKPSENGREQR